MMKRMIRIFLGLCAVVLGVNGALAANYSVTVGWVDSTPYLSTEVPKYDVKWKVGAGEEALITDLPSPGGAFSIVAEPGQVVGVAARNKNETLVSAWSPWAEATLPFPPTQPRVPSSVVVTVVIVP